MLSVTETPEGHAQCRGLERKQAQCGAKGRGKADAEGD